MNLTDGRILSVEKCFTWPGQRVEHLTEHECSWRLRTHNVGPFAPWRVTQGPHVPARFVGAAGNQALIFELEMPRAAVVKLDVNDEDISFTPVEILQGSRLVPYLHEAQLEVEKKFGITPSEIENPDAYFLNAWKMKLHRAAPQEAYLVPTVFKESPPAGRHSYYLRISQLNGHMAWSSPIWVTSKGA
jgi:hypothetical protein